ncbi:MAG: nuclear transport factor 2 family protein [Burkholderiales bacterium]|jgi:ketosteroid isomerase-like protein|nr:nuclear transport factor 2 family protein [Burkholderiales bacterium]
MPKAPLKAVAALGGSALDIESAFYDALQRADIDALMAVWADEDDVFCVHPGGPRLVGSAAIRAAFELMFANGHIDVHVDRVRRVESLTSSVHSVLERIRVLTPEGPREAWVMATNVYHKTAQGWRMVAHHASPGSPHEVADVSERPAVLH